MYSYRELQPLLSELKNDGIVICPLLVGRLGESKLNPDIFAFLHSKTKEYASLHWNESLMVRAFGELLVPQRFPWTSLYETVASSAVYLCENMFGQLDVTESVAEESLLRVEGFIGRHGYDKFISIYAMVTAYENYLALSYYGSMPEQDYLMGKRHRPWIEYSLEDELIMSCELGATRVVVRGGERFVETTESGKARFHELRTVLGEVGYLNQRATLLRVSQFSRWDDYESTTNALMPYSMEVRRKFLQWAGIKPGMNVLELGCGPGTLTIDSGLIDLVGPTGHVVAMDPALGMLARARDKLDDQRTTNIEFIQGRAEELPFLDKSFDAVIGYSFLHLTQIPTAVREMSRVTKPAGLVTSLHPLSFPIQIPFISEWFEPLLKMDIPGTEPKKDILPDEEFVPKVFEDFLQEVTYDNFPLTTFYTDPLKVVKFFVESVDVFEVQMSLLPWEARQKMIDVLIERGKEIGQHYPESELIIDYPSQCVRGVVM